MLRRVSEGESWGTAARMVGEERALLRGELVVLQEDIDWLIYSTFGLVDGYAPTDAKTATPDQRPMFGDSAHRMWSSRRDAIARSPTLSFLEDPMYKRLWRGRQGVFGLGTKTLEAEARETLDAWLQEKAETLQLEPAVRSVSRIALALASAPAIGRVLASAAPGADPALSAEALLLEADTVPYLAALRHTDIGLQKRALWESTWAHQRHEDAGHKVSVSVPPKYDAKDFRDPAYFRLRGKLDVPKERFISYPGAEKDDDKSPLYGWAGWDHLQQATALSALYPPVA